MRISFEVSPEDADRARRFFATQRDGEFVRRRRLRNIEGQREPIDDAAVWKAVANCLLTTQQRSGPDSAVARLIRAPDYPLGLAACRAEKSPARYVTDALTSFGGLRRTTVIGEALERNLRWLDDEGGWAIVSATIASIKGAHLPSDERSAAETLSEHLVGIGPKQSRNVLQVLGLTRFEVPIDSRLAKWLNQFGFPPLKLSATALGDHAYYGFVSDGFQAICAAADVPPCLMDAAIFASFDRAWGEDEAIW